jgi:hypothetical protein
METPSRSTTLSAIASPGRRRFATEGRRRTGGGVVEGKEAVTSRMCERTWGCTANGVGVEWE